MVGVSSPEEVTKWIKRQERLPCAFVLMDQGVARSYYYRYWVTSLEDGSDEWRIGAGRVIALLVYIYAWLDA